MVENPFQPLPIQKKDALGIISMEPLPWDIMEVYTEAWEKFKGNLLLMVGGFLAASTLSGVLQVAAWPIAMVINLPAMFIGNPDFSALSGFVSQAVAMIVAYLAASVTQVGMLRLGLAVARGETLDTDTLMSAYRSLLPFLGVTLLTTVLVGTGTLLLVIPGLILFLGTTFASLVILDTGLGVFDSVRMSWKITEGNRVRMLLFAGVSVCLHSVAGLLSCLTLWMVTVPLIQLCWAIIYTRVSGRLRSGLPDPRLD